MTTKEEISNTCFRRADVGEKGSPMHNHTDQESREVGNGSGKTVVITGALSYTGKYATRILLGRRYGIHTLTHHPQRENPFGDKVQVFPYNFEHPEGLTETLRGTSALINTYWVRFPHGKSTFDAAVQNTLTLIAAAKSNSRIFVSIRICHSFRAFWKYVIVAVGHFGLPSGRLPRHVT